MKILLRLELADESITPRVLLSGVATAQAGVKPTTRTGSTLLHENTSATAHIDNRQHFRADMTA